jgi:hypothetical protein
VHFIDKGKQQALVLSYREIETLIAFSSPNDKLPTLHGASVLIEKHDLSAYASDGNKAVRGATRLTDARERGTWLIPRSELVFTARAMLPQQDARFVLHPKSCALTTLELWEVEVDGTDHHVRSVNLVQSVPCNTQMGLPFEQIDQDLALCLHLSSGPRSITLPVSAFGALRKLSLAGRHPNLTLELQGNGLLHALSDGGTEWHAIVRPSAAPEVEVEVEVEDEDTEDDSLDEQGKLELKPVEKRGRGRGRPKGSRNKHNGKARVELV